MAKLSEQQEFVSILYYGLNGTGKTTNLAHMAKLGQVNYIAADHSGLKAQPLRALGVPVDDIEVIVEYDPLRLEKYCWQWMEQLEAKEGPAGICLDTLTELVTRRLEAITDERWEKIKAGFERRHEEVDYSNRFFTDQDYYNQETQELTRVIRHMHDLPCHLGISAQIRRDVDEDTGKVMYGPNANPALASSVMAYVDIIMGLEVDGTWTNGSGEDVLVGHPRPRPNHRGKDQFHVLPRKIVEPTFDRIAAYVSGDLTLANDTRQDQYRDLVKSRASARKRS